MLLLEDTEEMSFLFNHIHTHMEKYKKMSKSIRKFIRTQKAQIRRQSLDGKKQKELIKEMYNKFNSVSQAK